MAAPRFRLAALGLIALLGFALTALLLALLLPDPLSLPAEYRSGKLALIERWRGRANLAVFGTSRIHEGFLPEVFDAQFGDPPTSLNLGIVAGSLTEQRVVARRFLDRSTLGKDCPVWVLLEINAGLNLPPETRFDPRTVNLYDWDSLRFVAAFADPNVSVLRRLGRTLFALGAAAAHAVHAGMLGGVIFPADHPTENEDARGRIGLPQTVEERARVAAIFAARHNPRIESVPVGPGYARMIEDSARPNARFVYLVAPMLEDLDRMPDYPDRIATAAGDVSILNLARPDRFPALYRPENWRNATHMTRAGAEIFSRLLAGEMTRRKLIPVSATKCGD